MRGKKDRRQGKHALGAILIGFSAAVIATALILTSLDSSSPPPNQTVVLIDVTDTLSAQERTSLKNKISILFSSSPNTTFSLYEIVDDPAEPPSPVTNETSPPKTVADVNPLAEHRSDIEDDWKASTSSLMAGIDQATQGKPSQRSPLLESVQWVALKELNAPQAISVPRKLIIVSDLLQHTEEFSFYKGIPDFPLLKTNPNYGKLKTNLVGVEVEIWVLRNHTENASELADLWRHIVFDQGGTVSKVVPIP